MAKKKPTATTPAAFPASIEPAGPPVVPRAEKTRGSRLLDVVDLGLEQSRRILSIEFDPNDRSPANLKLISIISNTALQTIAQQARLDEAALRASRDNFDYGEFYRSFGAAAEPEGQGDDEHDE